MKKIKIVIPDDLTPQQEAAEIAQRLMQKALSGTEKQIDKLRIGTQVDIKELTTQITIERTGAKPIEMIKCSVCSSKYQSDLFFPLFVNYGGQKKKLKYCSQACRNTVLDICGEGRAAIKQKDLKPVRLY